MAQSNLRIIIDEDNFKEAKEKLRELYVSAHATRMEMEKALELAEQLEKLNKSSKKC